jgi:DedD protein
MDESLKARLIGAAVLVALAVLLIPELLSGRKTAEPQPTDSAEARGTRTFTIELNGGTAAGDLQPPPVVEAPASSPSPAPSPAPSPVAVVEQPTVEPPVAAAAESGPEPAPEPVAPREPATVARVPQAVPDMPPVETAPAPAAVTRGGWAVQVGAFGSATAAQRLVKDLQGAGFPAYVSPVTRSGKTLHRVRVGPEAGREDANRLAERLKGRGLPTAVVAND